MSSSSINFEFVKVEEVRDGVFVKDKLDIKLECEIDRDINEPISSLVQEQPETCQGDNSEKPLKCNMCNQIGEKPFACMQCSFKFTSKEAFVRHMAIHSSEKPYRCQVCGSRCRYFNNLKKHMPKRTFDCNICDYKCLLQRNLKQHMATHKKLLKCNICNFKCLQPSLLGLHKLTHNPLEVVQNDYTGEKPVKYNIHYAEKPVNSNTLSQQRPYILINSSTCIICKDKFSNRSDLKQHMLTHKGEKPSQSKISNYKFSEKHSCKGNVLGHNSRKSFQCEKCTYISLTESTFQKHIFTRHGQKSHLYNSNSKNANCNRFSLINKFEIVSTSRKRTFNRPLSCNLCNYIGVDEPDLQQHKRTHKVSVILGSQTLTA